jgi:glycosyltransferase involved in cell wall biosynthesis
VPRILALEPYYGGSHRAVLDGVLSRLAVADPAWEADLLTLPPRKWKWRMRGSGIVLAQQARALHEAGARWDVIVASTFVNLAEFVALAGPAVAGVPSLLYFHENQLLYPNRHTAEWDLQFPLTNVVSALAADRCAFNSRYNLDGFLAEIPGFFRAFPDHRPQGVVEAIAQRSVVVAPPFDPVAFDAALRPDGHTPAGRARVALAGRPGAAAVRGPVPRIVWPHRWEHDKAPERFFAAVGALADEGLDFEVAVAGQAFVETREALHRAGRELGDRLVHIGEPEGRAGYAELLASCDIAVSTADNEFFGLAMIEAAYAGCLPIVPDRLAYPEIYGRDACYHGTEGLVAALRAAIVNPPSPGAAREVAEAYTFEALMPAWLELVADTAASGSQGR